MNHEFAGARWWKFDFHTHTPFSKDDRRPGAAAESAELTPEEWLLRFMRAEIDCVAITDHNGGGWIDRLKDAYARMETVRSSEFRELHLFPGVELTVSGGIHILAIFDKDKTTSDIDALLGAVGCPDTEGRPDTCCARSLVDVLQQIRQKGAIAIPAHVDDAKGLLQVTEDANGASVVDAMTLQAAIETKVVFAMELWDPQAPLPQVYTESAANWTPVLGSDCHLQRHPGRRPGEHFTWIKMESPTLQGLALALLDGSPLSVQRSDECVDNPNQHAATFIESIEILDAQHAGRGGPMKACFSPWLSTLIGGRGSGKSTIIEMLRTALRRHDELPEALDELTSFTEIATTRDGRGAMRRDTQLLVRCIKDGRRFVVRWRQDGEGPSIEEQLASGEMSPSPGEVSRRFPVRIYSQKQIFALARHPSSLLRHIDDTAQLKDRDFSSSLASAVTQFKQTRAERRDLRSQSEARTRLEGELNDVRAKLELFEGHGQREVLQRYQRAQREAKELERRDLELAQAERTLREGAEELSPADVPPAPPGQEHGNPEHANPENGASPQEEATAREFHQRAVAHLEEQSQRLLRLAQDSASFREQWLAEVDRSTWSSNLNNARKAYEELRSELAEAGVEDPDTYGRLVQRRQALETGLDRLKGIEAKLDALQDQELAQLEEILRLRMDLSRTRQSFVEAVLERNQYVRMSVLPMGRGPAEAEESFRARLGKEDSAFAQDIYQAPEDEEGEASGILAAIYRDLPSDPARRSETITGRIRELKAAFVNLRESKSTTAPLKATRKRFCNHIQKMTEEQFDELLLWWPEDDLEVEYKPSDGSGFEPISRGSPGQRSAAILAFALSHGDEPIILDQPEDDLDTSLIYQLVVQQVRAMKSSRQVIIATHNPNIVVNGDAEQVIALHHVRGQCRIHEKRTGALQKGDVRDGICEVMEGGKEAFTQRYRRVIEEYGRV